jgi:hypothetical protein
MKYFKVKWIHDNPDDPVWLYSELNDASWEIRKVEVFRDGSFGFAGQGSEVGGSALALEPVPSIADIAADSQFVPTEINVEEFEDMWKQRLDRHRKSERDG